MNACNKIDRAAGFTLLEILVAFLVLTLALSVLVPSFSVGVTSLDRSSFYSLALAEARSQVDRIGVEIPLEAGEFTATSESGLSSIMRVRRQDSAGSGESGRTVIIPYEIEVMVSGAAGETVTLRTLRLAVVEDGGAKR